MVEDYWKSASIKKRTKYFGIFKKEYRCHTSRACSFVCPKEIDVAHFIALAKAGHFQDNNKPQPEQAGSNQEKN